MVELYSIDKEDIVTGPFDLLKLVEPALRARLKPRLRDKDVDNFVFILNGQNGNPAVLIDARGNICADVMFWAPKNGPTYYYSVNLKSARKKNDLTARIDSISYRGMEKAQNE